MISNNEIFPKTASTDTDINRPPALQKITYCKAAVFSCFVDGCYHAATTVKRHSNSFAQPASCLFSCCDITVEASSPGGISA